MLNRLLTALVFCVPAFAQFGVIAPSKYQVHSNITYYKSKLDVFRRRDTPGVTHPALIYIHGGGWTSGFREDGLMYTLPFLEMGWNVVNIDYRLAPADPAPAAVEDCLCALRWVAANAVRYGIDTTKLVVMGDSSGGHLALTTGMIPMDAGLDTPCRTGDAPLPKVAAIIDWYGITDVADLLQGANRKSYAVEWLSKVADKEAMAKKVSPMTYVRTDLPPIFIVHGDADPTVPYAHSVRLHEALVAAKAPTEFITIPGGKHGGFPAEERIRAYKAIDAFLFKNGLIKN